MTCIVSWIDCDGNTFMVGDTLTTFHSKHSYHVNSIGDTKIFKYDVYGNIILFGGSGNTNDIDLLQNEILNIFFTYENLNVLNIQNKLPIYLNNVIGNKSIEDSAILLSLHGTIFNVRIINSIIKCYINSTRIETIGSGSGVFDIAFKTYLINEGHSINMLKDKYMKDIDLFPAIKFAASICKKHCMIVGDGDWIGYSSKAEEGTVII